MKFGFISYLITFLDVVHFSEQAAYFISTPSSPLYPVENDNITLQWTYDLNGSPLDEIEVVFTPDSPSLSLQRVARYRNGGTIQVANDFRDRFVFNLTDSQSTMSILRSQRLHSGTYELTVSPDDLNLAPIRDDVKISVKYAAKINYTSGNQILNESDTLHLTCVANGDPIPNITWTRVSDNKAVSIPLIISGKQDEGGYKCTASNGVGSLDSRIVFIFVQSNEYINGADNDAVIITSVSERARMVIFSCIPLNFYGNGTKGALAVTVHYTPAGTKLISVPRNTTVLRRSHLSLICQTDGSPEVEFHLYFNDYLIMTSGSGIFHVSVISDGSYTCVPFNKVGTGKNASVIVAAVDTPNVTVLPVVKTVLEGSNLNLTCATSGKPKPNIKWSKVGSSDFLSNASLLAVVNVTRPRTANSRIQYQCIASNGVGTPATATASIIVNYPAVITNPGNQTFSKKPGEEVSFSCYQDGYPTPIVTWTKDDVDMNWNSEDNPSKVIFQVKESSSGWYRCKVENELNVVFKWFHLIVSDDKFNIKLTVTNRDCSDNLQETLQQLQSKAGEVLKVVFPSLEAVEATKYKCGSITVYLSLEFNQDEEISKVLSVLSKAVTPGGKGFGDFAVDPGSIQAISDDEVPSDEPPSTTKTTITSEEPTEMNICECSCKHVLLGAIIGVLLLFNIILVIHVVWIHKKETAAKQRPYEDSREVYDNEMPIKDQEADRSNARQFIQPRAEYMDLKEIGTERNTKEQSVHHMADYAPLHPSTRSWEVPRDHVCVEKIIGKGAFGQVAKGTAEQFRGRPGTTTVAIKMLKSNAAESDKRDLMAELDTMKQLKPHPHVIKLLGCVTESEPLLVLIEYVPFGDLLGYLRKSRGLNDTYYKDPDIKPQTNLKSQQLMKFSWQIADGMSYLSSKSIIHRDLAARNVLIGENETCKVTDFGMARNVQEENIYERKTKGRLPVKWTAYEALLYGKYTTKSDIWSYGVVLYEIFTIGGSPYPRMDGRKIANLLQQGYRMPKPQHVDDKLYDIMLRCWQDDPGTRPTFFDLRNQLKTMETLHKRLINMKIYDKQLYANVEDLVE
ncbi:fibroblast growth factor receptor 2-like isoform X2 [Pocillopora verrucosa]|uniref:fibroblast growth factor receptor 2-like isoform X2 n=1 Tax=Pocillopora verrucosa TaxID=203993 RepID=UPI00333E7DC6